MIINDKRNPNILPIKNILHGNCFIYKDALYIKTNASEWIEQANPSDCFCLRVATGRLTKLDKETIVTPVDTECNIITKDENPTTEKNSEKTTSKYILMAWTIFDDEVHVRQFDTKSEAQKTMKTNYNAVLSAKKDNETEIQHEFIGETHAKIETDRDKYLWQIKEIKI